MFWDDELEDLLVTWAEQENYRLTEESAIRLFEWCYAA
jgi:hypothetical protein